MKRKKPVLALIVTVSVLAGIIIGASGAGLRETITATLRRDLNIEVNGVKQTLVDGSGKVVYPIMYQGNTYVPFRAVGNMLDGVTVDWDQTTQTAKYITSENVKPTEPAKSVDLIDKCKLKGSFGGNLLGKCRTTVVRSNQNQNARVADDAINHWIRMGVSTWYDGAYYKVNYALFELDGTFNTLTWKAYASYDTVITVYNNNTKDSVLGSFKVKANESPSIHTIPLNGAFEIRIEAVYDKYGDGNVSMDDYVYLYNAELT